MSELNQERCEACRVGAPKVTGEELESLLNELTGWSVETREGIQQLEKAFQFSDFVQALAFTNRVGQIAEEEGHHPKLTTEWGSVIVTWWSHKIRGLHRNDFIMAAKTDQLVPGGD